VKATSGINGALTKTQIKLGIKDSAQQFETDTTMSAVGKKTKQKNNNNQKMIKTHLKLFI
jgi:hypothetical protein